MPDARPPRPLVVGDDLRLLRLTLPPLGLLLLIAAAAALATGTLRPWPAGTLALLGLVMLLWIETVELTRVLFDPVARLVRIEHIRGSVRSQRVLPYDQVRDIVVLVVNGFHDDTAAPLSRLMSLQLMLLTDTGDVRLSRHIENSLGDCKRQEALIWNALGRQPAAPLLLRSYWHALRRDNRLQGAWLAQLLEPGVTFPELEARHTEQFHARRS